MKLKIDENSDFIINNKFYYTWEIDPKIDYSDLKIEIELDNPLKIKSSLVCKTLYSWNSVESFGVLVGSDGISIKNGMIGAVGGIHSYTGSIESRYGMDSENSISGHSGVESLEGWICGKKKIIALNGRIWARSSIRSEMILAEYDICSFEGMISGWNGIRSNQGKIVAWDDIRSKGKIFGAEGVRSLNGEVVGQD